uniref:WH1 domain-containing protein n=1 Tax=Amphimedon queenslandica TaxID=400682 RepID=A0A1X7UEQ5_AMPQE
MDRRRTTSPSHRHLAPETVMRIEVSLSSRKSSVVVFNTTARLVVLGKGEWSSIAYGAPCILLLKETTAPDSPFQVKFAIAELESGIALWEEEITPLVQYSELQPGFHSFLIRGQTMAVQFADPSESASFHDSLVQYMAQKERIDELLQEKKSKSPLRSSSLKSSDKRSSKKEKKNQKRNSVDSVRRVAKVDISLPCEFRHLSGITSGHTDVCQMELEGSMQRQQRSASLGALSQKNVKQRGRIPEEMTDGVLYKKNGSNEEKESKGKQVSIGSNRGKFSFRSLRMSKKKPLVSEEGHQSSKDDSSIGGSPQHLASANAAPPGVSSDDDIDQPLFPATPVKSTINDQSIFPPPPQEGVTHTGWSAPENQVSPGRRYTAPVVHTQGANLTHSPQRAPLQPLSFQQHTSSWINGAFAKKEPVQSTYDMLEPLDGSRAKTQLSPPNKLGAPNLVSLMSPLHKQQTIESYPPALSPAHNILSTDSRGTNGPLSPVKDPNRTVSPPTSSGGDLDQLTMELSKVLKDFDDLITPQSPFAGDTPQKLMFQPPAKGGKETMV